MDLENQTHELAGKLAGLVEETRLTSGVEDNLLKKAYENVTKAIPYIREWKKIKVTR